jgi:hypothetical protein
MRCAWLSPRNCIGFALGFTVFFSRTIQPGMDIKRAARWLSLGLALVVALGFATCAGFYLPSTEKVHLTGTEIKRRDAKDGSISHDVRYIQARRLDGENIVFRNEDTRWGFPFYFKFDAADLASEAANVVRNDPDAVVLVTYYGLRSRVFDWYPNAVSFKQVPKDYVHVPVFNIAFVVVVIALCVFVVVLARRQWRRLGDWWKKRGEATAAK